jgi:hypothetical protein
VRIDGFESAPECSEFDSNSRLDFLDDGDRPHVTRLFQKNFPTDRDDQTPAEIAGRPAVDMEPALRVGDEEARTTMGVMAASRADGPIGQAVCLQGSIVHNHEPASGRGRPFAGSEFVLMLPLPGALLAGGLPWSIDRFGIWTAPGTPEAPGSSKA